MANARPMSAGEPAIAPATTIQRPELRARTVARASPPAARRTLASSAGVPPDESPMGGGTGVRIFLWPPVASRLDCVLLTGDGVRTHPAFWRHLGATFETCPRRAPAPPPSSIGCSSPSDAAPVWIVEATPTGCASDRGSALDAGSRGSRHRCRTACSSSSSNWTRRAPGMRLSFTDAAPDK